MTGLRIVVKLGHAFASGLPGEDAIRPYCLVFKRLREGGHELCVVAGGGGVSRHYVSLARALGDDWASCDQIGIEFTRINARLFVAGLGESAHPEPPRTLGELAQAFATGRVVVMGGLTPGHSTDAVAALAAEAVGAELLVRTMDVEGVYDRDPKAHREAVKLETVTIQGLRRLVGEAPQEAGGYRLIDQVALSILARSRVPTVFVDGRDPVNIERAVRGERVGTRLVY